MAGEPETVGTRERVLACIRTAATPPTVEEVAGMLDLHHNSVRMHAASLREAGLVTQGRRPSGGRGRPLTTYRTTTRGAWTGGRDYALLASVLLDDLRDTAESPDVGAHRAGLAWGRRLATHHPDSHQGVVDVLDGLGFEPEPEPDGNSVELRNCPFRELVEPYGGLVCALHAGMLDGLVEDGPTSVQLVPFSSPRSCSVRLSQR